MIAFVLFSLNSSTALDLIAKNAIDATGFDLKYKSIQGGLFSGLKIEGMDYEGKAKADLELDADFATLASGKVHIKTLKATNIWVDQNFLESLIDANSTSEKKEDNSTKNPLKEIVIDDFALNLKDIAYHEYKVDALTLRAKGFRYDMKKNLSGDINLEAKSNVADTNVILHVVDSHYKGDIQLRPKKAFVNELLQEQNITIFKVGETKLHVDGDLQKSDFTIHMDESRLTYGLYKLNPKFIDIKGDYDINTSDLSDTLHSQILSNVADINLSLENSLNLNDINNSLHYVVKSDISGVKKEFASVLQDANLSFPKASKMHLSGLGTMKYVDANVTLEGGEILYQHFKIEPKQLDIVNHFDIVSSQLDAKGVGSVVSNAADFDVEYQTFVDLDDINHTLKLDLHSNLLAKKPFLTKLLQEQNITLSKVPALHLDVVNKGELLNLSVVTDESALRYDGLDIAAKKITANVDYNLKTSDTVADINAIVLSNAGDLSLDANAGLKLSDINNTLHYSGDTTLKAKEGYLRKKLHDKRVKFQRLSPLKLHIIGDAKKAVAMVDLQGRARVGSETIEPSIKNTKVIYDLREHTVKSDIDIDLKSTIADIRVKGNAFVDSDDINHTLKYKLSSKIGQKKPFEDIDLRQLGLLKLDAVGSLQNLDASLHAKGLKALVKSVDFDTFTFDLDTKNLYIDKLYKKVPPQLKNSFVALYVKGYYTLKSKKAQVDAKVKKLKLSNRYIHTNRFKLSLDGDDVTLTPVLVEAKGFKLSLDAKTKDGAVRAHLKNKAVNGFINFKPDPLYADGKLDIPSIPKLLAQIQKVYPLKKVPPIKGGLKLEAKMAGKKRVKIALISPFIKLQEGKFKDIDIEAFYKKGRIDINRFGFWLKEFEPKEMNREVKLAHPGYVTFDGNDSKVDFVLKDFLSFKGEKEGDVTTGKLSTHKLYLGLKGYGQTKLTTDIDMFQSAKQLAVSGDITFEETQVQYESRYLDVSKDPDIIIIDEKHKKKRAADDSFRQNTFLDLHIKSKDAIVYKVEAGTVEMKPDIEVRKEFGTNVKILGKINILEGEYDVGDKRFTIKEGAVAFRGQEDINPLLDIHVEYPIDEVLILIDIRGDKRKPKLDFKSKPMMSKKDIFSYLLFGFAVSESDGAQSGAANAAEKIFGRALAKDLARELNLDRLDLTRSQAGAVNVKAGKKVTKKTIVYYQNKEQESSMIIERKLGRHFELDTEIGQTGQAVDLFYKKGFK